MTIKNAVARVLFSHAVGGLIGSLFRDRIPHRGLRIDTSSPRVSRRVKAGLLLGSYESAEVRFVKRYLPEDADVLELGGSIGVVTCLIRRKIKPDRKVVTVEADPVLAKILRNNMRLNDCSDVEVVEAAIDYGGSEVSFAVGESAEQGRVGGRGRMITVPTTNLSSLTAAYGFADFCIVSDIEGAEWNVLEYEKDVLENARLIIIETHYVPEHGEAAAFATALSNTFELVDRYGPVLVLARRSP